MTKLRKSTAKRAAVLRKSAARKEALKRFHSGTIGVRFLNSPRDIYSYKVKDLRKITLGQELVAYTPHGTSVVVVVRIDKTPNYAATKCIEHKVASL
jgi:hypothetical protein